MKKPTIKLEISIHLDDAEELYTSSTSLQVGEAYIKGDGYEVPREVLLAFILELEEFQTRLMDEGDVSEEELDAFDDERLEDLKVYSDSMSEAIDVFGKKNNSNSIKNDQDIDKTIDNFFNE